MPAFEVYFCSQISISVLLLVPTKKDNDIGDRIVYSVHIDHLARFGLIQVHEYPLRYASLKSGKAGFSATLNISHQSVYVHAVTSETGPALSAARSLLPSADST